MNNKEKFRGLCLEVLPLINEIAEAVKRNGYESMASLTIDGDDYFSFSIHGSGCEMCKVNGGAVNMCYEFKEEISMREEMMNKLTEVIKARIGEEYMVSLTEVKKNNGVTLRAVVIREPGISVCTSIYIDDLLDKIASGEIEVGEAAQAVIEIHNGNKDGEKFRDAISGLDKQAVLEKVEYQLINAERNKERIEGIPHKRFLDFAAVYRVVVGEDEMGTDSFLLSDDICRHYGIGEDEIDAAANLNTERKGFCVISMDSIIAEMMGQPEEKDGIGYPMWVLTNTKKSNGAAVMLYPDVFKELADRIGNDLYVLPSSIHEVIAIPVDDMGTEGLKEIVGAVNSSEVSEEEYLGENVYKYIRSENRIVIAQEKING